MNPAREYSVILSGNSPSASPQDRALRPVNPIARLFPKFHLSEMPHVSPLINKKYKQMTHTCLGGKTLGSVSIRLIGGQLIPNPIVRARDLILIAVLFPTSLGSAFIPRV